MVLDDYDPEELDKVMVQVSVRCRDLEFSPEQKQRRQCEECGADVFVTDEYALAIDDEAEDVDLHPEETLDDMNVFLCQVCGLQLMQERMGSGFGGVGM